MECLLRKVNSKQVTVANLAEQAERDENADQSSQPIKIINREGNEALVIKWARPNGRLTEQTEKSFGLTFAERLNDFGYRLVVETRFGKAALKFRAVLNIQIFGKF